MYRNVFETFFFEQYFIQKRFCVSFVFDGFETKKGVGGNSTSSRTFLFSNHIWEREKRLEIPKLASKTKVNGLCSTGSPGLIVVEGPQKNVRFMIN